MVVAMNRCDLKKWGGGGGWISSRSGWLLELLTELTNNAMVCNNDKDGDDELDHRLGLCNDH